jgi:hypothetical protein
MRIFSKVYSKEKAKDMHKNEEKVAIKHVHQNKKYKNREL